MNALPNLAILKHLLLVAATSALLAGCAASSERGIVSPAPGEDTQAVTNAASMDVEVRHITREFGNIDTNFNRNGVVELGIQPWETFAVVSASNRVTVKFAETYEDVPEGAWVGFMTDEGTLRLARNRENAAATLEVKVGDSLRIFRLRTE